MEAEHQYLVALKLFLVVGPLLGFGALELILLRRDKRRDARARSAALSGAGVGDAVRVRVRG
jgi:hypothetical protein